MFDIQPKLIKLVLYSEYRFKMDTIQGKLCMHRVYIGLCMLLLSKYYYVSKYIVYVKEVLTNFIVLYNNIPGAYRESFHSPGDPLEYGIP